jgi:hypothetical protein
MTPFSRAACIIDTSHDAPHIASAIPHGQAVHGFESARDSCGETQVAVVGDEREIRIQGTGEPHAARIELRNALAGAEYV